jgi:enterochelin esterase-like enzyme
MRRLLASALCLLSILPLAVLGAPTEQSDRQPAGGAAAPGADSAKAAAPAAPNRREPPRGEWLDPNHDEPNGTKYKTFASKVLDGRDVSYLVYLPPDYEQQTARYPVLYWLHGYGGNQRAGALMFVPHLDSAIRSGSLPPLIAVMVNGKGASFYRDTPKGDAPVESVIIKDLIPHIDQSYRTIADRNARIIQGYSMGGYGAGHLGFKYPELFGTVVIDAGAMSGKFFPEEHPNYLARQNADKLRSQTRIRVAVGADDDLLPANQQLHELLDELKIEHLYEVVPGVAHNAALYYKTLGPKGFEIHRKSLAARNVGTE